MPLGVPKVWYQPDKDDPESGQWMDLYNCMFRLRYLFLCNDLKEELTNQILGILTYLDLQEESRDEDVFLFINSMGGEMISGLAVFDMMAHVMADVNTIAVGTAVSMASFVLMGGFPGKRIIGLNARVMIHQPSGLNRGQGEIVLRETEEMLRLRDLVVNCYSLRTGQSLERIDADLERDEFLGPLATINYGLADNTTLDLPLGLPQNEA